VELHQEITNQTAVSAPHIYEKDGVEYTFLVNPIFEMGYSEELGVWVGISDMIAGVNVVNHNEEFTPIFKKMSQVIINNSGYKGVNIVSKNVKLLDMPGTGRHKVLMVTDLCSDIADLEKDC